MKMMNFHMARWGEWSWLKIIVLLELMSGFARSDPQIGFRSTACSSNKPVNIQGFFNNLNSTLSNLTSQLSNGSKHFATAQNPRSGSPVYAMVQCRNYLSTSDCIKCYNSAKSVLRRTCGSANGARVVSDGCSLRYEASLFFSQATLDANGPRCANKSSSEATVVFREEAERLMKDLELVIPKISNRYAAVKRNVAGGVGSIYGVAQCTEIIDPEGCRQCLSTAYENIQSCFSSTDARASDVSCFLRYSDTPFFRDNQATDITPFFRKGVSSKSRLIIVGFAGAIFLLLVLISLVFYFEFLRRRKASRKGNILDASQLKGPLCYKYADLKKATKHFHEANKLGEGGFGEVYKGTLMNGDVVAVKKLSISSTAAKAEFDSEVRLISNVHHRNLIRLLGFSSNGGELLLVYEYMRNGSLDRFLFGEESGSLNWKQRYDIIFGTAKGLAYLHEQFHVCIIHRDMKSSNILLDEDFQPKIADFGLARLLPGGHSHVTTRFAGTLGYTAPEYAIFGHLSEMVDIYGFGVVILEIISGRRSTDVKFEPTASFLLEEAWNLYQKDMHLMLVDESLKSDEYTPEEVRKLIGIALACTQSPASARPSMSSVVAMLSPDDHLNKRLSGRPTLLNPETMSSLEASTSTSSSMTNVTATFKASSTGR
ncbi:hypothetical protein Leryth_019774 [Lithospermum erythrorhizon]|nr:hypothetical protein Leryth_019774 [Lithospermum erythrorhizon]